MAKSTTSDAPAADPAPVAQVADPATVPALSQEQQNEVDQLVASHAATDQTSVDPAAPDLIPEPVPVGSYSDDAAMCVDVFADMATEYCADVAPLWPADKRRKVAVTLAAVFKKYNFTFARFGPEIALAMTAGPVLWQTSKIIAAQMNKAAAVVEQVRAPVPHGAEATA